MIKGHTKSYFLTIRFLYKPCIWWTYCHIYYIQPSTNIQNSWFKSHSINFTIVKVGKSKFAAPPPCQKSWIFGRMASCYWTGWKQMVPSSSSSRMKRFSRLIGPPIDEMTVGSFPRALRSTTLWQRNQRYDHLCGFKWGRCVNSLLHRPRKIYVEVYCKVLDYKIIPWMKEKGAGKEFVF